MLYVAELDEYRAAIPGTREKFWRDGHVKFTQSIAAIGIAAGISLAGGAAVSATPTSDASAPACTEGAATVVTDENGVQHVACVAVEAPPASPVVPVKSTLNAVEVLSATDSTGATPTLPATGATTGGLVIAAVLVGSGSLVSLLSRRRPVTSRKGFRRRRATP